MSVHDVSYVHPRVRQQSSVDMFRWLMEKADSGELVGAVVMWIDSKGTWHHKRDMFNRDTPTMLGYLNLLQMNLAHKYLTGEPLVADNTEDG